MGRTRASPHLRPLAWLGLDGRAERTVLRVCNAEADIDVPELHRPAPTPHPLKHAEAPHRQPALGPEILRDLLAYLDMHTLTRLSQGSRLLHALCREERLVRDHVTSRFLLHPGLHALRLRFEGDNERSFHDLYRRLDAGLTTYKGYALDASTWHAPYIRELIVHASPRIHLVSPKMSGACQVLASRA